jgi:hypothetical protein
MTVVVEAELVRWHLASGGVSSFRCVKITSFVVGKETT